MNLGSLTLTYATKFSVFQTPITTKYTELTKKTFDRADYTEIDSNFFTADVYNQVKLLFKKIVIFDITFSKVASYYVAYCSVNKKV